MSTSTLFTDKSIYITWYPGILSNSNLMAHKTMILGKALNLNKGKALLMLEWDVLAYAEWVIKSQTSRITSQKKAICPPPAFSCSQHQFTVMFGISKGYYDTDNECEGSTCCWVSQNNWFLGYWRSCYKTHPAQQDSRARVHKASVTLRRICHWARAAWVCDWDTTDVDLCLFYALGPGW